MSAACQLCEAGTEGYLLCRRCAGHVTATLRDIPGLAATLEDSIARRVRYSSGIGVSSRAAAETPLPVDLHAAEVATRLHNTLGTWVRDIADRTGDGELPPDDTAALAAWLMQRMSTVRTHPAAGEIGDEIIGVAGRGWRAVDRPAQPLYCGPCDDCGEDLYAPAVASELACAACGAVYEAQARRDWLLDQARDQLATATTIARALPQLLGQHVTPAMIRGYAHRGRLAARPGISGRPRYRVGDVIDLVAAS